MIFHFLVFIPESLAASSLLPNANTYLPIIVFLKTIIEIIVNIKRIIKPEGKFDRIMYYGDLELINVRRLDEKISDHYPVISEFEIIEN